MPPNPGGRAASPDQHHNPPVPRERRNHYRVLCVQPEAPPELVTAAFEMLVARLRRQADRGGRAERLAVLETAYAVLSDPVQRAAYDRMLGLPSSVVDEPACPFCGHLAPLRLQRDTRCRGCDSPLFPAPDPGRHASAESTGRRHGPRFERSSTVEIGLPDAPARVRARLRDLSLGGLSFHFEHKLPVGTVLRVLAQGFDGLAEVAACRTGPLGATVHARLLTLLITEPRPGVVLDAKV